MITFDLPWPDPILNPNRSKGRHWAATAGARDGARFSAYMAACAAIPVGDNKNPVGPISLTITFVQPDRRRRDRDNSLASLKPALDGVADALGIDDSQFEPMTLKREYGKKPGSVRIEIGE